MVPSLKRVDTVTYRPPPKQANLHSLKLDIPGFLEDLRVDLLAKQLTLIYISAAVVLVSPEHYGSKIKSQHQTNYSTNHYN